MHIAKSRLNVFRSPWSVSFIYTQKVVFCQLVASQAQNIHFCPNSNIWLCAMQILTERNEDYLKRDELDKSTWLKLNSNYKWWKWLKIELNLKFSPNVLIKNSLKRISVWKQSKCWIPNSQHNLFQNWNDLKFEKCNSCNSVFFEEDL